MKKLIVVAAIMVLTCGFGYYSYRCALRDGYIKHGDIPDVFMWQRDFWNPASWSYTSISFWELPLVLVDYQLRGRRQVRKWEKFYTENIAGRTVNETAPLVEEEIRKRIGRP